MAMRMASCDIDTLAKELACSRKLAAENWRIRILFVKI